MTVSIWFALLVTAAVAAGYVFGRIDARILARRARVVPLRRPPAHVTVVRDPKSYDWERGAS